MKTSEMSQAQLQAYLAERSRSLITAVNVIIRPDGYVVIEIKHVAGCHQIVPILAELPPEAK